MILLFLYNNGTYITDIDLLDPMRLNRTIDIW